jgi:hypothetical protein
LNLEEPTISDLGAEALRPYNSPITDLSVPIMVQVVPPRVTHHEHQIVLQAAMEENVATSSGSPHTPSTTATTGGVLPPNSPSQVWTTMVSTASTSGSGLIPSMVAITAPFTQSATGPPFSYGMPGFDTNSVLSYSTLQTMGLGAGSSNAPLQGSMGGTSAPYNAFPYGGGHIPPSSPSLGGASQQPVWPNMNYNLFGAGSQGPSSNTTQVGSLSFSLFDAFGNNTFSSAVISVGGNPGFGQQNPVQGTIPAQGENTSQGPWNPWQGSIPSSGMSTGGNPFHGQWNPGQGSVPMPIGSAGGNPFQNLWNTTSGEIPSQPSTSNYGSQSMTSQQAQYPYAGHDHGFTRTLVNSLTFPGNLVPAKIQAPFSMYIVNNPSYHFWQHYIFQT